MTLVYYDKSHRYKLDGQWVPGVTTLIKGGLPAPALMYWSARSVAEFVADKPEQVEALRNMGRGPMVAALKEVPWQARDMKAVRGSDVHALAERLSHGERVDVPEHLAGHVEACVQFLDDWQIRPLITERPVASRRWQYAGTPDLLAEFGPSRALGWFDYKTGSGIYPETAFQVAAYGHAEFYLDEHGDERELPEAAAAFGVQLRGDGYEVFPLAYSEQVFREFCHIAFVARTAERAKGYVGQSVSPPTTEIAS